MQGGSAGPIHTFTTLTKAGEMNFASSVSSLTANGASQ